MVLVDGSKKGKTVRTVKTRDLAVGMYVMLGLSWFRHSFLKPNFIISSKNEIKKIIADGIKTVRVDFSRSKVAVAPDVVAGVDDAGAGGSTPQRTTMHAPAPKRDAPDARTSQGESKSEQPAVIDTVTLEPQVEQEGSGIDTVTIEDRGAQGFDSGIDTIHIEEKPLGEYYGRIHEEEPLGEYYGPIQLVKTKDLEVGMYVTVGQNGDLPARIEENFRIANQEQIENLVQDGIRVVSVDVDQSEMVVTLPPDFRPQTVTGAELRAMIESPSLTPQERAGATYHHSLITMKNILSEPSARNILRGNSIIFDVVRHILSDEESADHLLLLRSYDYHTHTHSVNVGVLSVLLARRVLGDTATKNVEEMGPSFFLHDLGKCEVPASIINKPGKLTASEWELMRSHPERGKALLAASDLLTAEYTQIVMQHHEREDGTGYPLGLRENEIGLHARICNIADTYDALTSQRPFRSTKPLHPFRALELMKEEMINEFNRDLFETFISLFAS